MEEGIKEGTAKEDNTSLAVPLNSNNKVSFKEKFRTNWIKTDELCPACGHVVKEVKGLTRQNIRRLFSFKGSMMEFILFIVVIFALISAYAYNIETKECRDFLEKNQAWIESIKYDSPSAGIIQQNQCSYTYVNGTLEVSCLNNSSTNNSKLTNNTFEVS